MQGSVVAFCALAVALAGTQAPPASRENDASDLAASSAAPATSTGPTVVVDPASWWMESGENATFAAAWVGTPAGCSLEPIWFRWAVAPGGSEGALGPTNGSETVFASSDQATGSTPLSVRAAASLECRGNVTAVFSQASAVVTVAAPVTVDDLSFATAPIAPGASGSLTGLVSGGVPPYRLRVAWEDGTVSFANVSGSGPFSVAHAYEEPGTFAPVVLASDATGQTEEASPEEPLTVSAEFAAAIVPSALVAEVGVPVTFGIRTADAPPSFSSVFSCEDATPATPAVAGGLSYGCEFDLPGVAPVSFQAVGASSPFPVATATLEETVVPSPSVAFPSDPPGGELGGTVYAPIRIAGGVPPFTLNWSLVGAGSAGSATARSDGISYLALTSGAAGTLVLSVVATDALGEASAPLQEEVVFVPSLQSWAAAVAGAADGTIAVNVSASASQGAPPYDWTVVADEPAVNGSADAGTLLSPGGFAWNATYREEGTLGITVIVVDATGVSAVVALRVDLAPRLAVVAEIGPAGPGAVSLRLTVSGGVAPFAYRWNDSAGDVWAGNASGAGTLVLHETTDASGPCSFDVDVVDALGVSASSQVVVNLPGGPSEPSTDPVAGLALAASVLVLVGAAGAFLVVRRRRSEALPPPDPVAVLREAIEPSDGVDRGLVELLAEERGVPLEVVRATLERLKADGIVRAGRGSDGEEVLAWSGPEGR